VTKLKSDVQAGREPARQSASRKLNSN
jgi:hypothetical protein